MNDDLKAQELLRTIGNSPQPNNSLRPTFGSCPQCNLIHPPLRPGEICPNAPVKIEGISDQQINLMLSSLKNILVSQIQVHKITDGNKLLKDLIIHIMKFFEENKQ
jgi:hypothetical protein